MRTNPQKTSPLRAYVDANLTTTVGRGDIAKRLGLYPSQLNDYLSGSKTPGPKVAKRIAKKTGISAAVLMGLDEAQGAPA